jgi:F-type H+-transporting ATPase subunit delta
MNESKITTRYAKALFKLAQEQNLLDKIKQDLDFVYQAIDIKEFRDLINSPIIPVSQKKQVFVELFKDRIDNSTLNFLLILAENRREQFLKIIILDFYKLYRQALGITQVELITAVELSEQTKQEFINILKKITNHKIDLIHKVNPEIIGGFIIRIDDRQLDTSIATQLQKLKKHISQ